MRLIVPAYFYPSGHQESWDRLLVAGRHLGAVVINPRNGPGQSPDPVWHDVVARLGAAGIDLLGYVDVDYNTRSTARIREDIERFERWYGLDSLFLDRVHSSEPMSTRLRHSLPPGRLVGNPGTAGSAAVAEQFHVVVDREDEPSGPIGSGDRAGVSTCWMVHSCPVGDWQDVLRQAAEAGATYVWVTDRVGANPYDGLPTFWDDLLARLDESVT